MPCTLPYGGGGHMLPAAVLAGESALVLAGDVGHARIQRSQRQCCQSTCAHGQMLCSWPSEHACFGTHRQKQCNAAQLVPMLPGSAPRAMECVVVGPATIRALAPAGQGESSREHMAAMQQNHPPRRTMQATMV